MNLISFQYGGSILPPGHPGQNAGSSLWCQIGDDWYRCGDKFNSAFKVKALLIKMLKMEMFVEYKNNG